uniref:Uncharacterized protein n=1 Tax=Meloidogyne javanica TaxID=6303 RepID=A0A915NCA0_MELJA
MKLKTFVSFLLLFGAFSGTFLCVTTQQEDYNDVADNIWDPLHEENPQIEQNQDDSNNENNKDPPTPSSVATNSDSTAITSTTSTGNLTTQEMTNTTKNIPETPTDNQVLPADLNDVRINYTRKLCAVYEVGSEIEYVVDEFERPVKDSPRTKWFKTYEAKIKRGEYESDLNDSATPTDSERGTDIEQDGPSTED